MTEPRSAPPWPVWALVTLVVAAIPLAIELLKRDREPELAQPPQGQAAAAMISATPPGTPAAPAASEIPQLTYGTWTLRAAKDESGTDWTNSTLRILTQTPEPGGLALKGVFEWRVRYKLYGVEQVAGHYLSSGRQLILEGVAIELRADRQLGVGSYSAVLSPDARSLISGRWGAVGGVSTSIAGTWSADR